MHMSPDTFNKIATMLQADAKAFKAQKLEESIGFKKNANSSYTMTLDSMGIGNLEIMGDTFKFTSKSALGEKFNGAKFATLDECKKEILSFMLGEKKEPSAIVEEVEELDEKRAGPPKLTGTAKGSISFKNKRGKDNKMYDVVVKVVNNKFVFDIIDTLSQSQKKITLAQATKLFENVEEMVEGIEELDEKYDDDHHIIMQLRKAQDVNGKMDIKFHKGPSGRLTPDQIDMILKTHDKLNPDGKRKMRVILRSYKDTLDMLKEDTTEDESIDEAAFEKDLDAKKKVVVSGVKGAKSRPFKKTFRNMAAYDKWSESDAASDFEVSHVVNEEFVGEGKEDYTIMHPTYSSAVQHARAVTEKRGFKIDEDDYHNKVTTGPRKPSSGKTNRVSIDLEGSKKKLHMQVYNTGNKYELNMYVQ